MDMPENIEQLYDEYLLPELRELEKERKKITAVFIAVSLILIVIVAALAFLFHLGVIFVAVMLFGIGAYFFLHHISGKYVGSYKTKVLPEIVAYIDLSLKYSPTSFIDKAVFSESMIFPHPIDIYTGDDYVKGKIGSTKIEFSELDTEYFDIGPNGRQMPRTIFKGLFFVGDFNKKFAGSTFVLPDTFIRKVVSKIKDGSYSYGEQVKLENPEFEKYFASYSDDQVEARYILSPSLMERINTFRQKTGKKISLSFIGSKVFIAVPFKKDLFEPRIFRTMLDIKPIEECYENFKLMADVVEDLDLNTRIWMKK